MNQNELFHDTIYDALGADIAAAGGFKVVAGKLWPSDPRGDAKLRNALNVDQPHKLDPDEQLAIKRLARAHGSSATVNYEAQQIGYTVTWVDPTDRAEELRRVFREDVAKLTRLAAEVLKADERAAAAPLKAVR